MKISPGLTLEISLPWPEWIVRKHIEIIKKEIKQGKGINSQNLKKHKALHSAYFQ